MRALVGLLVGLLLVTALPMSVTAADPSAPPNPADELVVRYRADTTTAERRGVVRELGLTVVAASRNGRTEVVVGLGKSPSTVRRQLQDDPRIAAVAHNYSRELAGDPTDGFFEDQWGLHNTGQTVDGVTGVPDADIDGLEALRLSRGNENVVVAVVDDGVDFSHPDLADRAWTNPDEIAGNGVDDDNNGFVDDVHGWDFCDNDASVYDPPLPGVAKDGHGTHVAGTIAASLNGSGVVGVAPGVRIMALKFIKSVADGQPNPCGRDDMAIDAIDYAASFGVPIINASWGSPDESPVLDLAIADSNALFVAAAGNEGVNIDSTDFDFFPAESPLANVLTVAAVDQSGKRPSFSNYGLTSVDIGAPGRNILSSYPGGFAFAEGTSMAAPHVSGVAALVASGLTGAPTPAILKTRILTRGTSLASMAGRTVTGRLLNAWRAVDIVGPVALPVARHGFNVGVSVSTTVSTTLVWPPATDVSGVASYVVKRRIGSGAWSTVASAVPTGQLKQTLTIGSGYRFGIAGRDGVGNVGPQADSPAVTASLFQDATSLAKYAGAWSTVASSSASGARLHRTTRTGASVTFTTSLRAVAVVARKHATNGQAKVYVDGAYVQTINLYRSSPQSKIVVFNKSWPTNGVHTVKVVAVGTAGHPGVDIDAFAILR